MTFLVTVPPTHQFHFIPGKRVVGAQWISEDSQFDTGLIAHITMSIDLLTLRPTKDKTYHAELQVAGLHYTVRKKADSDWLEQNISTVEADQRNKVESPAVQKYKEIQKNSLHMGLVSGVWNSGNKDNTNSAKQSLNYTTNQQLFPGDLDKVKGMISTVGAEALKNKTFTHGKDKKKVELAVRTASIVVA